MQVTETLSEGLKRVYRVVLPAAGIAAQRNQKIARLQQTFNLPGFRPGKVPASLIQQRHGQAIDAELQQEAVQTAVDRLLQEHQLRPVMPPTINGVSMDLHKDWEFQLEIELLPEIKIPDLTTISLVRLHVEPTEMAVDAALVRLADNQQTLATVESVPGEEGKRAEKGEIAVVDFAGKIDGLAFPGGTASGAKLEVAGPGYIPGFTEQIEGMKVGEPCDIHVTFPNNYPATEFAGKDAIFTITIKTLYKKIRPEINDALAEKLGFENLQSLRQAMVSAMHKEYGSLSRMQIKRTLLDHLSEHTQCLLPDSMVEAEFKSIWDRFEDDRKAGRMDEDDARKDENTLKAEYRAIAERRVKLGLLFQEISRMHNIHVSQHELDEAINAQASRFGEHEARTITLIKEHKSLIDALHGPLLEDKVVDFILEQAMIVERTATVEELTVDCEDKAA